jgi:hypothetical protein
MIAFVILIFHTFRTGFGLFRDPRIRVMGLTSGLLLIVGTTFYRFEEGWSWLDSVYFCVMLLTTVGLGDFAPTSDFAKVFTIFYAISGIAILLATLNAAADKTTARKIEHELARHQSPGPSSE